MTGVDACRECRHRKTNGPRLKIGGLPILEDDIGDVEDCIRPELESLWAMGIETVCSCCGHGLPYEAYVGVTSRHVDKMLEMGYEMRPELPCNTPCGVFFAPKSAASLPTVGTIRWYEKEGDKDYMFDVHLITQKRQTTCGPVCLKMLLDYYGIEADMDALIEECGVGVNGCSASDLLRVGRAHGLEDLAAYQEDPADVLTQDRPAILWWRYTHYVVYCGTNDEGEPVIANPLRGIYAIDADSFAALCSGLEAGTYVALCNGMPGDLRRVAAANYAEGELFESQGETCVALRPITRGETLTRGYNYDTISIVDALNAQKGE